MILVFTNSSDDSKQNRSKLIARKKPLAIRSLHTSEKTLRLAQLSNVNNTHKEWDSLKPAPRAVCFSRGQTWWGHLPTGKGIYPQGRTCNVSNPLCHWRIPKEALSLHTAHNTSAALLGKYWLWDVQQLKTARKFTCPHHCSAQKTFGLRKIRISQRQKTHNLVTTNRISCTVAMYKCYTFSKNRKLNSS